MERPISTVPEAIFAFVERFDRQQQAYRSGQYNETQLRCYAWSARLPLSVLTDFEEFAVYDCRVKPVKTDKASKGRILYLTCPSDAVRHDQMVQLVEEMLSLHKQSAAARTGHEKTHLHM